MCFRAKQKPQIAEKECFAQRERIKNNLQECIKKNKTVITYIPE